MNLIAVEYLDDLRKASGDTALAALLASAAAPFDRAEWWEGLVAECGMTPLYALARGADGAALLALSPAGGTLTGLANWYTFRWRPLITHGAAPAPLLAALAHDLARRADRLTLAHVPEECGSASALAGALRGAGWFVTIRPDDSNHVLAVAGRNYEQFLADRPGPLRTTLKRKAGKVSCTVHHAFSDDIWAAYQAIYAASWKPAEGSPDFLERFARAEAAAGRLRLGIAEIAGQPVAAQLWTVEGGTAYIHKLAHREDAAGHSPGSVLSAALFAEVIDCDRVAGIDFGTGDDLYKRGWMDDVRPRYRIEALHPRSPRVWPALLPRLIKAVLRQGFRAARRAALPPKLLPERR